MIAVHRWLAVCCAMIMLATTATAQTPSPARLPFNAATWNLRLDLASDGPNAWPQRREMAKALILYHEFDLLGTQEGLINQVRDLEALPGFARVGVGRDDGQEAGEHAAIFYRQARFALLDHGDFWLSPTPDVPSLGWDARCCKRLATWARLRDVANNQVFYVYSVHFDHEGEVARRESAKLMLQKMAQIADRLGPAPIVCLGDFNSTPDTPQIRTMAGTLRDARAISATPPYGPEGTFNGFKLDAPMAERIDYVFVSPGVRVLKYGVLSDSLHRRYPSDHHPVVVRLLID
jgi:endonuclease/exonuclease/phosphatase family metal-dependent hydrolase